MAVTIEQVRRRIEAASNDDLLQAFADELFGKADPEFMETFDADSLLALAKAGLRELQTLDENEVRVRVFNPSYQADGFEAPYTVVEVILRDRPFVVDSVRAELRRLKAEVYHLLHPILKVWRDEAGTLVGLGKKAPGKEAPGKADEAHYEAFELYFVNRTDDAEKLQTIEKRVREVLQDVVLATRDYRTMKAQAGELHDYLDELPDDLDTFADRAAEVDEYAAFMTWLLEDNYVFLGYRGYDIVDLDGTPHLKLTPDSGMGILSKLETSAYQEPVPMSDIPEGLRERVTGGRILTVTKTNAESTVHRPARMDYIGIKKVGDSGEVEGEQRFVGLFTSKALSAPVEDIPILRLKLEQVLKRDGRGARVTRLQAGNLDF